MRSVKLPLFDLSLLKIETKQKQCTIRWYVIKKMYLSGFHFVFHHFLTLQVSMTMSNVNVQIHHRRCRSHYLPLPAITPAAAVNVITAATLVLHFHRCCCQYHNFPSPANTAAAAVITAPTLVLTFHHCRCHCHHNRYHRHHFCTHWRCHCHHFCHH